MSPKSDPRPNKGSESDYFPENRLQIKIFRKYSKIPLKWCIMGRGRLRGGLQRVGGERVRALIRGGSPFWRHFPVPEPENLIIFQKIA